MGVSLRSAPNRSSETISFAFRPSKAGSVGQTRLDVHEGEPIAHAKIKQVYKTGKAQRGQ